MRILAAAEPARTVFFRTGARRARPTDGRSGSSRTCARQSAQRRVPLSTTPDVVVANRSVPVDRGGTPIVAEALHSEIRRISAAPVVPVTNGGDHRHALHGGSSRTAPGGSIPIGVGAKTEIEVGGRPTVTAQVPRHPRDPLASVQGRGREHPRAAYPRPLDRLATRKGPWAVERMEWE